MSDRYYDNLTGFSDLCNSGGVMLARENGGAWHDITVKSALSVGFAASAGSVENAVSANSATYAVNAGSAASAGTAVLASSALAVNSASEATHAISADSATNANSAASAAYAINAGSAASAGSAVLANSATTAANANSASSAGYALIAESCISGGGVSGDFLPLSGGTMSGPLRIAEGNTSLTIYKNSVTFNIDSASATAQIGFTLDGKPAIGNIRVQSAGYAISAGKANEALTADSAESCTGNAATATSAVSAGTAAKATSCTGNAATASSAVSAGTAAKATSCTGNAATATSAVSAGTAATCTGNATTATLLRTNSSLSEPIAGYCLVGGAKLFTTRDSTDGGFTTIIGQYHTAASNGIYLRPYNPSGDGYCTVADARYTSDGMMQLIVSGTLHAKARILASKGIQNGLDNFGKVALASGAASAVVSVGFEDNNYAVLAVPTASAVPVYIKSAGAATFTVAKATGGAINVFWRAYHE